MTLPAAFTTSKSQLWMTPPEVLVGLRRHFDIQLDVCASEASKQAPRFYSEADDAFTRNWAEDSLGVVAFCNPPYGAYGGHTVGDWVRKGYEESLRGATVVFLLPLNKMDQAWFHQLAIPFAEMWLVQGRINFLDPETGKVPVVLNAEGKWVKSSNSQGSMILIFGPGHKPCAPKTFWF